MHLYHDSIADLEKHGLTKDDWCLVVEIIHGHGCGLTQQKTDLIFKLLYDLRKGIKKKQGRFGEATQGA